MGGIPVEFPLYIGLAAGIALVLADDIRLVLLALIAQYGVSAFFASPALGGGVAVIKAMAGVIVAAILYFSLSAITREGRTVSGLAERPAFRVAALLLVLIAGWGIARAGWLQGMVDDPQARFISLEYLAIGLLLMSLFHSPFRVALGALIFLSGFEVFYSSIEPSLAVVALLHAIHIGIAIAAGYLSLRLPAQHPGGSA